MTTELRTLLEVLAGAAAKRVAAGSPEKHTTAIAPVVDNLMAAAATFVFIRRLKSGRIVAPLGDFRKALGRACHKAGLPCVPVMKNGTLVFYRSLIRFHDNRRSAYRRLIRDGIPERVAMSLVGWKDRKTADRYNIVNKSDFDNARDIMDRAQIVRNEVTKVVEVVEVAAKSLKE